MVHRLAIILIICALGFGGCKKFGHGAKETQLLNPGPAPSSAALTPTPALTPAKPVVDQTAQTIIFCYHRLVDKVRYPGTEITPPAFELAALCLSVPALTVVVPVPVMLPFNTWIAVLP